MATIIASAGMGAVVGSLCTYAYRRYKKFRKAKKSKRSNLNCDNFPENVGELPVCPSGRYNITKTSDRDDICQITNSNTNIDVLSTIAEESVVLEDTISIEGNEFDLLDKNNYDEEFLTKCRDPGFLETQMRKIEDDYKDKMKKLQIIRRNEIAKNEAQYEKIKVEVFNENVVLHVT